MTPLKVPRSVLGLYRICDDGSSRFSLMCVQFERDAGGARAIASDGVRMCVLHWADACNEPLSFMLQAEDLKVLTTIGKDTDTVAMEYDGKFVQAIVGTSRLTLLPGEGRFPRWRECIDNLQKEGEPELARVSFDVALLAGVLKAVASFTPESTDASQRATIVMRKSAIVIEGHPVNGRRSQSCLMSLRCEEPTPPLPHKPKLYSMTGTRTVSAGIETFERRSFDRAILDSAAEELVKDGWDVTVGEVEEVTA